MTVKEFFRKMASRYLWGNLLAMAAVVVLLCVGLKFGLDLYTNHGEEVVTPNVVHKDFKEAAEILEGLELEIQVSDTGYVKSLPANCVLDQSIAPGEKVKPGRIIFVTINAANSPTIALPDVIDNSSYREAVARLRSMGFRLGQPEFMPGEKDWVYGIKCKGRQLATGDRVSIEDALIIQVGDGRIDASDSINYVEPNYDYYYNDEDSTRSQSTSDGGGEAGEPEAATVSEAEKPQTQNRQ